jgi:internalin A
MYAECPMNPLSIRRQRPEAGLAYERHHFTFPSPHGGETPLFDYDERLEYEPAVRETRVGARLVDTLGWEGLPQPPLCFTLLFDAPLEPGGNPSQWLVRRFVQSWPGSLFLVFSGGVLPGREGDMPLRVVSLIQHITGTSWTGPTEPGWVPLADAATRQQALNLLSSEDGARFCLLATRSQAHVAEEGVLREMTRRPVARAVPFASFHRLVQRCDWVLTTHRRLPGRVPFCFYSANDPRPEIRRLASLEGAHGTLVEVAELRQLPGSEEATSVARSVSTEVTGIDGLLDKPGLRELNVDGVPWLDTSGVSALGGLESLSMRGVKVDDLDFLVPLRSLRYLALDRAPFHGLGGLSKLNWLRSLWLGFSEVPDLGFLRGLPALESLTIEALHSSVPSLEPLAALPSLRNLSLGILALLDIRPLASLRLEVLELHDTSVESIEPLRGMGSLRVLRLISTKVGSIDVVRGLPDLRELSLLGAPVADLSPLMGLCALEVLNLEYSEAQDYSWLAGLSELKVLFLNHASITESAPLARLSRLRHLVLRGTQVADPSFLRRLTGLEVLDLVETPILDFTPLRELPVLRTLKVEKGRLPDSVRDELIRREGFLLEED